MKTCTRCKESKPLEGFSWENKKKGKAQQYCRTCATEMSMDYYNRHKEEIIQKRRARYDPRKNKDQMLRKYGITVDEYDTMFVAQKGLCEICGSVLDNGFFTHVDHSHETGKVRALLCKNCNPGLGQFKHSIELLESAIVYLKKHR